MAELHIHIDGNRKEEFVKELLLHDSIYGSDIEERANDILVQADIAHDFIGFDIDSEKKGVIKVIFCADCNWDQPVTVQESL